MYSLPLVNNKPGIGKLYFLVPWMSTTAPGNPIIIPAGKGMQGTPERNYPGTKILIGFMSKTV
jgi:hypothetical protein